MTLTEQIKAGQRALKNRGLYSGEIDGIDGRGTWGAILKLLGISETPAPAPVVQKTDSSLTVGDEIAHIAESQIGTQEDAAHTNRGSAILKYQQATNLGGQGWPWCAAFVDWCVKETLNVYEALRGEIVRPKIT